MTKCNSAKETTAPGTLIQLVAKIDKLGSQSTLCSSQHARIRSSAKRNLIFLSFLAITFGTADSCFGTTRQPLTVSCFNVPGAVQIISQWILLLPTTIVIIKFLPVSFSYLTYSILY